MATREGRYDTGTSRGERAVAEIGAELRSARLDRGLSQAAVAAAAHMCRSKLSRIERGHFKMVPVLELSRLCSIIGLELSVRAFPGPQPIRDAAQQALLGRIRAAISPSILLRTEVPLPLRGDARAWDAWLALARPVAIEAETRPRDLQATQRRINLKRRDDPRVGAVVLLLADTRRNRDLARAHREVLEADFPVPARELMEDLAAGRQPRGSAVVLL